jgi:hypothetical protein
VTSFATTPDREKSALPFAGPADETGARNVLPRLVNGLLPDADVTIFVTSAESQESAESLESFWRIAP